jgi:hypothetical protein
VNSSTEAVSTDDTGDSIHAIQPFLVGNFLSSSATTPTLTTMPGIGHYLTTPDPSPVSPRAESVSLADSSDLHGFSAFGETTLSADMMDFAIDMDGIDFFLGSVSDPSSYDIPMLDTGHGSNSSNPGQTRSDIASLLIPSARKSTSLAGIALSRETTAVELVSNGQPPSSDSDLVNGTAVKDPSSCGHLTRALDLLKMLSLGRQLPQASVPGLESSVASDETNKNKGRIHTVLKENKHCIEVVEEILGCKCSDDCFLHTTLSMVVLKMLGRYAIAARTHPVGTSGGESEQDMFISMGFTSHETGNEHTKRRAYDGSSDEVGTVAPRLVLRELYHVQRLVNQITTKVQSIQEAGGNEDDLMMGPFSTSTLDQIKSDLRNNLNTLSTRLIKRLRDR